MGLFRRQGPEWFRFRNGSISSHRRQYDLAESAGAGPQHVASSDGLNESFAVHRLTPKLEIGWRPEVRGKRSTTREDVHQFHMPPRVGPRPPQRTFSI